MTAGATLRLDYAAFGTLSNGASAQLLAEPAGRRLDGDEMIVLRTMFEAARPLLSSRITHAYAMLPLGRAATATRWMLCRLDNLGVGAIGWCGVLWGAMVDAAALDRPTIGWAVHRMLRGAFPAPYQPEAGERIASRIVPLDQEAGVPTAWRSFDNFAADAGAEPTLLVVAPSLMTPEQALHALWSRKLPAWRRHSFSSWTGFGTSFDVIASATVPALGAFPRHGVLRAEADAAPLPLFDEITRALEGVPFPVGASASTAEIDVAARGFANRSLADLAALHSWSPQPNYCAVFGLALGKSLGLRLTRGDPQSQRTVFDALIAATAGDAELWSRPGFTTHVARMAIDADALPALPPAALRLLAPALTSAAYPLALTADAARQLAAAPQLDWELWWPMLNAPLARNPVPMLLAAAAVGVSGTVERDVALNGLEGCGGDSWPLPLHDVVTDPAARHVPVLTTAARRWLAGAPRGPRASALRRGTTFALRSDLYRAKRAEALGTGTAR